MNFYSVNYDYTCEYYNVKVIIILCVYRNEILNVNLKSIQNFSVYYISII